jgi:hypothetical protein
MIIYYAYLKINHNISFEDFQKEDPEVINTLLALKKIEIDIINKKNGNE